MQTKNTSDILVSLWGDKVGLEAVSPAGTTKLQRLKEVIGLMDGSILLLDTAELEIAFMRIDAKGLTTLTLG